MVYCSSSHSHYILQEFSPYATSVYTVVVLCFLIPLCAKLDFIYLSLKHSACDCLCVKTKLSQCACISEYYCNIVLCALFKYNFYWFSFPTSCCTTWQHRCKTFTTTTTTSAVWNNEINAGPLMRNKDSKNKMKINSSILVFGMTHTGEVRCETVKRNCLSLFV